MSKNDDVTTLVVSFVARNNAIV